MESESSYPSRLMPEEFMCAITQELMRDPVINEVGQTYEKEAI